MNTNLISKVIVMALFLSNAFAIQAQHSWAMAMIEDGQDWPSFNEYHCEAEKGGNGVDYYRIYDNCFRWPDGFYTPKVLQYGYRLADKQIYVYDFDTNEERLAFDFTLSVGDHFITYNGMEWTIAAVTDTLVNISYKGLGESCTKRLLKVRSTDGIFYDQWLEDFGSFANHLMILPMSRTIHSETLFMEYDRGCYLVRELSSDPFYTHDLGIPDKNAHGDTSLTVTYKDGTLTIEHEGSHRPNREYILYYRVGDNFYHPQTWILNPITAAQYMVWHKHTACFTGLPEPQSGEYTIHPMGDRPLSIVDITNKNQEFLIYDLQGRPLSGKKSGKGVYVSKGRKVVR